MTKRVPIRVLKKPTVGGRPDEPKRPTNAMTTGIYSDLSGRNLDGRSKLAKAMNAVRIELIMAIGGNPSPQQRILIDRVVYKLARTTLFEVATLAGDKGADEHYLAWSNSLRLDLQALGLDRIPPKPLSFAELLAKREAERASSASPTSPSSTPAQSPQVTTSPVRPHDAAPFVVVNSSMPVRTVPERSAHSFNDGAMDELATVNPVDDKDSDPDVDDFGNPIEQDAPKPWICRRCKTEFYEFEEACRFCGSRVIRKENA